MKQMHLRMPLTFLLLLMIHIGVPADSANKRAPVTGFDVDRYLGTWYEIARLDHRFERNMTDVTANYSIKENGDIRVLNKGYDTRKAKWKTAEGKAKFRGATDEGSLKVSFFGPFYGAYNIIALDEDYQYALVAGPSLKYLWILARTPELEEAVTEPLLAKAKSLGYTTENLIWVTHERTAAKGESDS